MKSVYASNGPSVNIASGLSGRRTSKRGSVSLNFKIQGSSFRVINMHLKSDSFANRLRDLSKVLAVHRLALEDQGTNIFMVGAFNLGQSEELANGQAATPVSRSSCQLVGLKTQASDSSDSLPGISAATERSKKIDRARLLQMVGRLQEGDFDQGVVSRVRNQHQEGLVDSLFHDRVFWLESNRIEHLDYDVRTVNMANPRPN